MSTIVLGTCSRKFTTFQSTPRICQQVYENFPNLRKFLNLNIKMDLRNMRTPYNDRNRTFNIEDLVSKEPFGQFKYWFEQMIQSGKIVEPNAVCLSTCTKSGMPSSRMVLLKGFGADGFKFYTNYSSRKGSEMFENPNVALLFYWDYDKRQIRIEGSTVKMSPEESEEYFQSRPRDSQVAAAISPQSQELDANFEKMKVNYSNSTIAIPRPEHWGGVRVIPEVVEFWQGQSTRLHDRIRFRKSKVGDEPDNVKLFSGTDGWVIERLAP